MPSPVPFALLLALLVGFPAHPATSGTLATASPPAFQVFLGPDSNACGITPAYGGATKRKSGIIIWLHGGMRSANRRKGLDAHRVLLGYVPPGAYHLCSPSAFGGQEWPTSRGLEHIDALIDYMVAHYSVDTCDVNFAGVSDGSLGVVAYSLKGKRAVNRRVLISSFPQLVLSPASLSGQERLTRGTWDFLQGGRDRLFPADQVVPFLRQWEKLYPNAHLHYFPDGEHDFSFYAEKAPGLLKSLFSGRQRNGDGASGDGPARMKNKALQK